MQLIGPDGCFLEDLRVRGSPQDDLIRVKIEKSGDNTIVVSSADRTSDPYTVKRLDLDK